jgi:hypothetical protein
VLLSFILMTMSSGDTPVRPGPVLTGLAAPPRAQYSSFSPTPRLLPSGRPSQIVRSCKECRRRKIRCDRGHPCSYCVKNRIECAYSQGNPVLQRTHQSHFFEPSALGSSSPELKDLISTSSASRNDFASARPLNFVQDNCHGGLKSSGFAFGLRSLGTNLQQLHPTPERIFSLWQTYLETVDPLLKIFHTPTVQRQITQTSHKLDKIDPAQEALMFSIYYAAITSMRCPGSQAELQEDRNVLLERYRFGAEQALARAGFLATQDLTVLQAFILYLICARRDSNGPDVWTLTSLAVRIAMRLGLHRDQDETTSTLSHYEIGLRRRLWWQICILDIRTAEDGGTDPLLYEHMFNVRLPSNINDADLDQNMRGPPTEIRGRTEMLSSLVRLETSFAARMILFSNHFCEYNSYPLMNVNEKIEFIDDLGRRLEDTYLKFCDVNIPVCFLTVSTVKVVLRKLKLVTILKSQCNSASLPQTTKDTLFETSIEILEYAHKLKSDETSQRWIWLFQDYVEWDVLAYVLYRICERVRGEEVDRAWKAVNTAFHRRQGSKLDESKELRWRHMERLRLKAVAIYHCALIEESRGVGASIAPDAPGALRNGDRSTANLSSGGLNLANNLVRAVESSYPDIDENHQMARVHDALQQHSGLVDNDSLRYVPASGSQEDAGPPLPAGFVDPFPDELVEMPDWGNLFQGFPVDLDNGALSYWL